MAKKKKAGGKDKRVHCPTWGTSRPLCGAKSGKVSKVPGAITCEACGRVAVRLAEGLEERAQERQAARERRQAEGVGLLTQPRWWERTTEGGDG